MEGERDYIFHNGFDYVYAGKSKKFKTYKCIRSSICKARLTINLESDVQNIYSHELKCKYQQKKIESQCKNINEIPKIGNDLSFIEEESDCIINEEYINDSYDSFKDEGFNIYYKDDELKNVM